jgi:hypothetical protein
VRTDRRRVWFWTIPAGIVGWVAAGAILPSTIPACGWKVIESGIVRTEVWINHGVVIIVTTALAFGLIVGYSRWVRRRTSNAAVDVLLCVGFGATAWALPYLGLAYTISDHWEGAAPLLGDGSCGLLIHPGGHVLVAGGVLAIVVWVVWMLEDRAVRARTPPTSEETNN